MESLCSEKGNRLLLMDNLAFPTLSHAKGYQEKVMNRALFLQPMRQISYSKTHAHRLSQPGLSWLLMKSQGAITATSLCYAISYDFLAGGRQELLKIIYFMNVIHLLSVIMRKEKCWHQKPSRWAGNILVWSWQPFGGPRWYLRGL